MFNSHRIPNSKTGDCSQCDRKNVPVVKRGKLLYCKFSCAKKEIMSRKKESSRLRATTSTAVNKSSINGKDVEQEVWYIDRSKEMTGRCVECGGKSTKGDPKYWKFSICHILAKSVFPSVAKHPLNFIELCFWGESHHTNMDSNGYAYVKENMPRAWKIIVTRFRKMYPSIIEKNKIPDVLLNEILNNQKS